MKSYDSLQRMIFDQPEGVNTAVGWALVLTFGLMLIGGWLPLLLWFRQTPEANRKSAYSLISILPLMLSGGVILLVLAGTFSAYVFANLVPGLIFAGLAGVCTLAILVVRLRQRTLSFGTSKRVFVFVTGCTFGITLWQHAVTEFDYRDRAGESIVYSDLNDDTSFHVYLAVMVRETGLPLRDLYGSPEYDYCHVTHTGHGVLIAGLATVSGMSEFRTTACLWIATSLLLCWASMAIVAGSELPGVYTLVSGLVPLVFGPLMMPSILPLFQPDTALQIKPLVSARMYWNLPQALSTALAAVSLILFQEYCRRAVSNTGRPVALSLVALSIVAAGLVKPSIFIFYAPALAITLLAQRARLVELVVSGVIMGLGCVVYLLPAFLVDVPELPSWSFRPTREQSQAVVSFVCLGCGAALLMAIRPLIQLFRDLVKPREPQVLMLPLIAMGGSLLFAILFREERFVGHTSFQPNIWWGPSACVVLLIPLLIRSSVCRKDSTRGMMFVHWASMLLLAVHVINGSQFALATPANNLRAYPKKLADTFSEARERTAPDTRFLLDPRLAWVDLVGFLRRPVLLRTSYMSAADAQNLEDWNRLFDDSVSASGSGWAEYDAAILVGESDQSFNSRRTQEVLSTKGWRRRLLTTGYQLWIRPVQIPASDEHADMAPMTTHEMERNR